MAPAMPDPGMQAQIEKIKAKTRAFIATFPQIESEMQDWRTTSPCPPTRR